MDLQRRYERVRLPETAQVHVLDDDMKLLGRLAVIGPGGMLVATSRSFVPGSPHHLVLVDEVAELQQEFTVIARYNVPEGAGFEFRALDVRQAVYIGVIIGRYYAAAHAAQV